MNQSTSPDLTEAGTTDTAALRQAFRRDHPEYFPQHEVEASEPRHSPDDCWAAVVALRGEILKMAGILDRLTDSLLELHSRVDAMDHAGVTK